MSQTRPNTHALTRIAFFAAVIAVLAQIAIPLPSGVPATLQTFAIALAGYTLGSKRGAMAVVVYLLLGAVGVPVFANFKAGAAVLFGVTGGFLWAFTFLAAFCGFAADRKHNAIAAILLGLAGLTMLHLFGLLQFSFITNTPLLQSFLVCTLPFIIKDALSVALAYFCAKALRKRLSF